MSVGRDDFEQRLRAVDARKLTPWVRMLLGDQDTTIESIHVEPLTRGFAEETVGGRGAYRYSGKARSPRGMRSWSLILKVLGISEGVGSGKPRDWNYRRREVLAYRTGVLDDLPDGIAAPKCFAVETVSDTEVWIWLEEVTSSDRRWDMPVYARVAHQLGQFNGAYLTGHPLPDRRWFTRGRVRNWLDLPAPILDDLPGFLATCTAPHWLTPRQAERVTTLWHGRAPLLRRLEALPRCLCHHDAFPRNLFPGPDKTVAIDWQIMGTGAIGEELTPLVAVSLQFLHMPPSQAKDLEAGVIEGYVAGLRDAGWRGDEWLVRLGYGLATGLFAGVATVGMWYDLAQAESREIMAGMIGGSIGEVLATWRELQEHFLDLAEAAAKTSEAIG